MEEPGENQIPSLHKRRRWPHIILDQNSIAFNKTNNRNVDDEHVKITLIHHMKITGVVLPIQ